MWISSRILLIIALLIAATIARSEGIYNPTAGGWFSFTGGVGGSIGGGISNSGVVTAPATPCSGTGLIFNVACNSQYIGII